MKNMDSNKKLGLLGFAVLALMFAVIGFWPRSQTSLVIVNGVEYKILSYGKAEPQLSDGTTLDAYVLTVTYEEPEKGLTRGTVMVPKTGMKYDFALPENTVVWDPPITLEGKTYALARWNPSYSVPARDKPPLIEEPPLTRTQ